MLIDVTYVNFRTLPKWKILLACWDYAMATLFVRYDEEKEQEKALLSFSSVAEQQPGKTERTPDVFDMKKAMEAVDGFVFNFCGRDLLLNFSGPSCLGVGFDTLYGAGSLKHVIAKVEMNEPLQMPWGNRYHAQVGVPPWETTSPFNNSHFVSLLYRYATFERERNQCFLGLTKDFEEQECETSKIARESTTKLCAQKHAEFRIRMDNLITSMFLFNDQTGTLGKCDIESIKSLTETVEEMNALLAKTMQNVKDFHERFSHLPKERCIYFDYRNLINRGLNIPLQAPWHDDIDWKHTMNERLQAFLHFPGYRLVRSLFESHVDTINNQLCIRATFCPAVGKFSREEDMQFVYDKVSQWISEEIKKKYNLKYTQLF